MAEKRGPGRPRRDAFVSPEAAAKRRQRARAKAAAPADDRCETCGQYRELTPGSFAYFGDVCALDALRSDPDAEGAVDFGLAHGHARAELVAARKAGRDRVRRAGR